MGHPALAKQKANGSASCLPSFVPSCVRAGRAGGMTGKNTQAEACATQSGVKFRLRRNPRSGPPFGCAQDKPHSKIRRADSSSPLARNALGNRPPQ